MIQLYKKELNYYLNNPVGYVVIILFAVLANFFFVKDIFVVGSASLQPFFNLLPWLFLVFTPAISMRALAEEKRTNTIETLLTLPISETQIVLAKFTSLLTLLIISLLLTFGLPISLFFLTASFPSRLYLPEVIVGYLGVLLVGASFISLCLYFSSKTKNQVVAFLGSLLVIFFLVVAASDFTASLLSKGVRDIFGYLSPTYHLQSFVKGVIDLRAVVYNITFIVLFLFLTVVSLEKRS